MHIASAQIRIYGTVYDNSGFLPLPFVSVLTSSGKGISTNVKGNYSIVLFEKDSIWFSYLGKQTREFTIGEIDDPLHFDISLLVNIPELKEIKINPHHYREDSIQNRFDYAKGFNYKKPTFGSVVTSISITGFTVDIDEFIRVFQYQKKLNALSFQRRLIQEEKDKFVDNRFSKALVLRLTGLKGEARDSFMFHYRPTYEFTKTANEYDFYFFIKNNFKNFMQDSSSLNSHPYSNSYFKSF